MAQRNPSFRLAADLGAAAIDASITLWWRWPILMAAGLPGRDTAELSRMVVEKAGAATAGMIAAQTEVMRLAASALAGRQTGSAPTTIAAAALRPALRTVKRNAKRRRRRR
jgi:hypothetical protein